MNENYDFVILHVKLKCLNLLNIKCIDVMNFFTIGLLINKIWCYCHITFISWWNIFCIYFSVLIFDLLFESWMNVMSFTYISGVFLCFACFILSFQNLLTFYMFIIHFSFKNYENIIFSKKCMWKLIFNI